MPDQKLSQLPAANGAAAADLFYLVQGGASKKITTANVFARLTTNILPSASSTYTLGNANLRYRAIYTASDGIYLSNSYLRGDANGHVTISGNLVANSFASSGSGVPTLRSNTNINLTANANGTGGAVVITNSALRFASFTTTQRNSLSATTGDVIYNTSTNKLQAYISGSWVDLH